MAQQLRVRGFQGSVKRQAPSLIKLSQRVHGAVSHKQACELFAIASMTAGVEAHVVEGVPQLRPRWRTMTVMADHAQLRAGFSMLASILLANHAADAAAKQAVNNDWQFLHTFVDGIADILGQADEHLLFARFLVALPSTWSRSPAGLRTFPKVGGAFTGPVVGESEPNAGN